MKIIVINKELTVDSSSFQPLLRLTVDVPIEVMMDNAIVKNVDEVALLIGKAMIAGMKEYEINNNN